MHLASGVCVGQNLELMAQSVVLIGTDKIICPANYFWLMRVPHVYGSYELIGRAYGVNSFERDGSVPFTTLLYLEINVKESKWNKIRMCDGCMVFNMYHSYGSDFCITLKELKPY